MRKHLFVTLLLTCGMPYAAFQAIAAPEPQSQSQSVVTINGTVLDENGEGVIGATVKQKGTSNATATDAFGHFTLKVKPGATLNVTYVGYKSESVAAAADMVVYLQPTTGILDEVVVIGYGTQKKVDLTGAVATVDVERVMDSRPQADVVKALQGAVPGLSITTVNGDINSSASMKIRGTGTLTNSQVSSPLIVVDGVPTEDLSFLNPDDIADISVLKDAASSSIYGSRAAFGVILITTKTPAATDKVSVSYSNNFSWSQATMLPSYASVPQQIRALMQANNRAGLENELFGMYLDKMLPYAEAWEAQNGGQAAGYREMKPFQSWENVGDYFVNPDGSGAMYYANWDVTDIMFNSAAPGQKHNVSLEGTSGKTSYRLSFGYDSKQGLLKANPDKLHRYTANASIQTQIFDWLQAGARFNFSDKEYFSPNVDRTTYTYMWRWGSYFGPYGYMLDEEGNPVDCRNDILYRNQAGKDKDVTTQTRMQAWLKATLLPGLTLQADFAYNLINRNNEYCRLPIVGWNTWGGNIAEPAVLNSTTHATQSNTKNDMWTMNVYATYAKAFGDHNLKLMVGGMAEQEQYNYFSARRMNLVDVTLPVLALTNGDTYTVSNSIWHRATAGFFGRLNYDYKGIYLLEGNVRYDGSSRFPAADQWAWFPSVSAGYRFSQEAYFEGLRNVISNGKIRGSYGHIGNEAVGSNRFISTIGQVASGSVNWIGANGQKITEYGMPTLVSSSLSWERIITTDAGIDLGFFNNALNFSFDWYQRDTKDMLSPGSELPNVLGASAPYQNAGSLRTRGWEISANYTHSFGDAQIYVTANLADARTKITKWSNKSAIYSWQPGQTSFCEGTYYGDIWGLETDRYFEESDFAGKNDKGQWIYKPGVADQTGLQSGSFIYGPGDIKFKDLNGDGVINGGDPDMVDENGKKIATGSLKNHGDLKVIGNATPRYEYSFRIGGNYKGFDLDLYFQGVGKREMWSNSAFVMPLMRGADATYANQESYNKMIFDDQNQIIGYEIDQNNDFPCMFPGNCGPATSKVAGLGSYAGGNNFYTQTKYLMNLAYLRFKSATIGYTLPYDWTKKAYIQKARIYFSADNLFFLYNGNRKNPLDPEVTTGGSGGATALGDTAGSGTFGRTAPMQRTYSFGLQVTF